jgi:hypothetical protein
MPVPATLRRVQPLRGGRITVPLVVRAFRWPVSASNRSRSRDYGWLIRIPGIGAVTRASSGWFPPGLPRPDIHLWLGNITLMVMRGLEDGDGDLRRFRSILRRFVVPAFTRADAQVGM